MAGLAVNVDHIATLRQARQARYPDPVAAAVLAELAGADGIVAHLREDRRHMQDRDIRLLRKTVQSRLIMEMAATPEMIAIAIEIQPDLVTLVPERREELTTEGGLDLIIHREAIAQAIGALHEKGLNVSLFIDPDPDQIKVAHRIDADMIEIHTGAFCNALPGPAREMAFARVADAARLAAKLKLGVNAGHGLCYQTIKAFKGLKEIDEFSIGHSIVAQAALVGMERAVGEMRRLIEAL